MAVLPGATSNRPTPGGMPDSRQMGKVGPTPSMPKMGAGPAEMGSVAGVPDPDDLVDLFTSYTSGQMSRDDLIGQLHTFSEGQGGILGLLEGMDQSDTGSRTAMSDQAVDVVGNQGGGAGTSQPVMPGGVMPGVGLEVGGVGTQGGQGVMAATTSLGAIPELTEPLDQRHQRISMLLQGFGLQSKDADQMSTILNPHIDPKRAWVGHDTGEGGDFGPSATETTQTWTDKSQPDEMARRREDWVASTVPTTSGISTASDEGVDLVTGGGGGATETIQTAETDPYLAKRREEFEAKKLEEERSRASQWDVDLGYPHESSFVPKPITTEAERNAQMDQRGESVPYKKGDVDAQGRVWDGNNWVAPVSKFIPVAKVEKVLGKPKIAVPTDVDFSTNPFFAGFNWPEGQNITTPDGKVVGYDHPVYGYDPVKIDGMWWPNKQSQKDFARSQEQHGWIYDETGKRRAEFAGWQGGKYGLGQAVWEKGLLVRKDGGEYRIAGEEAATLFYNYGYFPDGTWLKGWGPDTDKPLPPGFTREGKPPVAKTPPPTKIPAGAVVDADGNISLDGKDIGWQDDDGTITFSPDYDDPGTQEDFIPPQPGGGAGGMDLFTSEDYLYGKKLFDPQSVDSNQYPGLSELVQSLTEGGERSESLTATVINAVRDMEMMKIQGDENAAQLSMKSSISNLDRNAVTERARLDRELAIGVATGQIAETATLAAEMEKNAQLMREYQLSGMMPAEWQAELGGVPTLEREAMGIRETEAGAAVTGAEAAATTAGAAVTSAEASMLSIENRREQDLSALFGQYIAPDRQPADTALTLDAQQWGWTKKIQEAEMTGKFPTGVETLSAKRLSFEKDIAAQKNTWETRRLDNESASISNQQQINTYSISSNASIESGKLSEAVAARKAKFKAENAQLQFDKDKLKIETLLSLSEPATFLFATRLGLLDNLGVVLGVDFSDEMYPGEIPSMLEPGTIPTMQQLRAATPAERQLMLAEMASSGGYSVEEALSRVQAGTPGGRAIRRESMAGVGR